MLVTGSSGHDLDKHGGKEKLKLWGDYKVF